MNPKRVLTKETVILRLKGADKPAVLEELTDLLAATGRIKDRKAALKAIWEREKKMSTGLQNGIAIPHGKTDLVDSLIAVIGIKKEGIDFDSLDGQPAQIILMTLSPASRTGPHIQFLADISRTLHDATIRQQVLEAGSEEQLLEILSRDRAPATPSAAPGAPRA